MKKIIQLILLFEVLLITPQIVFSQNSRSLLLVPQNYSTIQSAINASGIGDTVFVSTGIYNENINFYGKPIMVTSQYLAIHIFWTPLISVC